MVGREAVATAAATPADHRSRNHTNRSASLFDLALDLARLAEVVLPVDRDSITGATALEGESKVRVLR